MWTSSGQPFQSISSDPSIVGGVFVTAAGFISDAITVGDRLTINAGVRFDHSRAISQDLPLLDEEGRETNDTVQGDGTLYTWNVWSPRAGVTMKLTGDGRTMLRASYGRFNQGVLTGELTPFHLADVWFLHVLPCVRAAGFKRVSAAAPQASTIAGNPYLTFGQDPNSLTNATGLLPNDRSHMFRVMGSVDVPRTGVVVAANVQQVSGKPWAATTQVLLPQGDQRIFA